MPWQPLTIRERIFGRKYRSFLYEVTPRCNLRCAHCYNVWKDDVGYDGAAQADTATALRMIRKAIRESGADHFTFTGGEPTLREDLETLVAEAARFCSVTLITNGTRLDEGRIRALMKAGVGLFELPLNGPDAATHDLMEGREGAFAAVVRATADIRFLGGEVAFVFVATKLNIGGYRETLDLGLALGVRSWLFNRYNAGGECHGRPDQLMPGIVQIRAALAIAQEYALRHGLAIGCSIALPECLIDHTPYPNLGFGYCAAGTDRMYLTMDPVGNIRPCNHTPLVLGNILETPLRKMTTGSKMRGFACASPDFCAGCKLESVCQGSCKAAAEACYGTLNLPDPFVLINRDAVAKPQADNSRNSAC